MTKNKKSFWSVVTIIVVVGLVLIVWVSRWNSYGGNIFNGYQNNNTSKTTKASPSPLKNKHYPVVTTAPASVAEYSQLKNDYDKVGRLIQFDSACNASPTRIIVKTGYKVMIDNRSSIPKTIAIDGRSYNLSGYSYEILIMNATKTLPYDIGIDCKSSAGNTENSGTINMQAAIYRAL